MRAYVSRLVLLMLLLGSMLLLGASPVAAHCVQTDAGLVTLRAGHFAALHGHLTGIANSGQLLSVCTEPFLNPNAPDANPGIPPGHQ
jgi:hypothetical protein